jgi:hypothetical protein
MNADAAVKWHSRLTTSFANGGGEEILVESSPPSGMAMCSNGMP